ncbi:TetR/AcrR family transcriptional regulator [Mesorhizobium sp. CAU 1741]|uniref:TetR/AcrR family transcriptional regulator n=1 Tax=Mesorhizobium sp. CAU 1741 TaxID=3140366 RepID=UPI00325B23D8
MGSAVSSAARRDVRSDIMDAAERVFAGLGFDGATTRAIADEAKVNLGLIHYHFNSKEALFEQVVARRTAQVNGRRHDLLAGLLGDPKTATLESILDALMRPTIELSNEHGDAGQHYSRIIVQIASGTDDRSIQLTAENFNPIALEFIDALESHVPDLGRENAVWAYMNAISVGLFMIARTGRVAQLSDGLCDEGETEEAIARVVRYLAAGTRALVAPG